MSALRLRCAAPGKVNPLIAVGAARPDGRHDQLLVLQAVSLADDVELEAGPGVAGDAVHCPGVPGENLVTAAIAGFRAHTGWDGPPVRISVRKRVPVAAGMGGGSADAGAALRLLAAAAGVADPADALLPVARRLGADVPHALVGGLACDVDAAGGHALTPSAARLGGAAVLLRSDAGLSTGAVYAEADRLGRLRTAAELEVLAAAAVAAATGGHALPDALWANDLQAPALSLRPDVGAALAALEGAGARRALVSGSGPTALGWFDDEDEARRAAGRLAELDPAPVVAVPVGRDAGEVRG